MKLLRCGAPGAERPAILDRDGTIRDATAVVGDFVGAGLSAASLAALREIDPSTLPKVAEGTRIGPCVGRMGNFIAVGLNYADHAAETNAATPVEPILFNKAPSCLSGPNDDVIIPKGSTCTDWEVELAIVIGERTHRISQSDAMSAVAGFCLCNDVSERAYQIERGGQFTKGKSAPTFGPLGPWLVTPDEVADVQNLGLWLEVNGERMQDGSTSNMIFGVSFLVSYISQFMVLEPGDVITTGTPAGVALGMKPPRYLKAGDVMTLGIEGMGTQRQRLVAEAA
jgi:2-keto-4-pentenoate hydratase/2-oxohepta-3-ene-1,7-dioic acid hydratase in catechol pathway